MIKKMLAVLAIALTAMLVLPPEPADARRGGGGGGGGGFRGGGGGGGGAFRGGGGGGFRSFSGGGGGVRSFSGGGGGFRAGPVFRSQSFSSRPVYYARPRVRFYSGPVYYRSGGCGWLRQRAIITGSPYWWRRYRICIGAY